MTLYNVSFVHEYGQMVYTIEAGDPEQAYNDAEIVPMGKLQEVYVEEA
tara:strand:- start:3084 stop:3227 length:144 start_codon:yes stop_codon:yes gene_type:complete